MKPYYKLDDKAVQTILYLRQACIKTGLGNISFHYSNAEFHLDEYKSYWGLTVASNTSGLKSNRDIYEVDGLIHYKYSETDY
jgi:hypothetical protein